MTSTKNCIGSAILAAMCTATTTEAQQASEIFLGYSFLQADPGGATFNGIPIELETNAMHGAEATATYYTSPRLGFDFTFAVHNGNIAVPPGLVPEGTPVSIDFRQVAFMAGPRVRLTPPRANFEFAVRAVVGASIGNARAVAGLFALDADSTVLALSTGASLSVRLGDSFKYRIAQPELYITKFGDATQVSFRVSTGIVFGYGR